MPVDTCEGCGGCYAGNDDDGGGVIFRLVSYERYDEGRVVAYQDRKPDKFYYVISGRLSMLTEYQLHTGTVTRVEGYLKKGMHTDVSSYPPLCHPVVSSHRAVGVDQVEELEEQRPRQHHLVAKGGVELMTLEKDDFFYLTKLDEGGKQ